MPRCDGVWWLKADGILYDEAMMPSVKRLRFVPLLTLAAALFSAPLSLMAQSVAKEAVPDIPYGGHHEFGALATYSWKNGPTFGYDRNTRYATGLLRYSYQLTHRPFFNVRYSPELTTIAMLYERSPSCCNPAAPIQHFGAGFNPISFQGTFFSRDRIQPFIDEAGGFIYYGDRVLSPGGSQFMFTIDYGAGVNYYITRRNAATLGFRYQHQSNADTTVHNPGTDAMEMTLGFSHFHTKDVR